MTSPDRYPLNVATRRSPLALAQARLVIDLFGPNMANARFHLREMVTTGDRQAEWSLEKQGGKGLFTGELERALISKEADLAVHSGKDLPSELGVGLVLAGYLPREDPHDVLILPEDGGGPMEIATGSPRRRQQLARWFPTCSFSEIRGNVETRLRKVADREVGATVLAAAGLKRLGIDSFPGTRFEPIDIEQCVPAAGQAAIAVQCRESDIDKFTRHLDVETGVAVTLERAFLRAMEGGCQTAFAVHFADGRIHLFHDDCGYQSFVVPRDEATRNPQEIAMAILKETGLKK